MKYIHSILLCMLMNYQGLLLAQQHSGDPIDLRYKILTKQESKKYFKTKKIMKKGYQPIEVTITNNSDHPIDISLQKFNIPTVSADGIIFALHKNSVARGLIPASSVGLFGLFLCDGFLYAGLGVVGVFLTATIGATIGTFAGIGACIYNKKIERIYDFSLESQLLQAHETITGMIFVHTADMHSNITLNIGDQIVQGHLCS